MGGVKPMCLICNGMAAVVKSSSVMINALQNNAHGTVWCEVLARVCRKKLKSSAAAEWLWTTNWNGTELHYPTINQFAEYFQQGFSQLHSIATITDLVNGPGPSKLQWWRMFRMYQVAAVRSTYAEARGRICRLLDKIWLNWWAFHILWVCSTWRVRTGTHLHKSTRPIFWEYLWWHYSEHQWQSAHTRYTSLR